MLSRAALATTALVLALSHSPAAHAAGSGYDEFHPNFSSPEEVALCEATGRCGLLMGQSTGEQPKLGNLIADIAQILGAPAEAWVHSNARPPVELPLRLVAFLRECYQKILTLKVFLLHPCLEHADPPTVPIVQSPIPWPPEREKLMSEYLQMNTGNGSTTLSDPTTIALHWTGTPTYASAYETFSQIRTDRGNLASHGAVAVSCHFLVDRDGTIHQLMPTNRAARHVVGLNRNALCIENVGGPDHPLTDEQLHADEMLVEMLVAQNPTIDNVIGHSEYRAFENTYIFTQHGNYRSDRDAEPGRTFLRRFRSDLFDYGEQLRTSHRCGPES